jgi:FkbM family methyltransferase
MRAALPTAAEKLRTNDLAKRTVRRLGLERPARALLERAQRPTAAELDRGARDDEHLRLLLAFTLSPTAHCIDVGAHHGDLLRDMVRLAPAGRHLAYEPLPEFATSLRRDFPAVEVREAALGDEPGETSFVHVRERPAYSGLRERDLPPGVTTEEIQVRVERLDDTLPDGFRPDFMKVDVEGAELQVFRGALETLRRYKPTIWFEHGVGGADRYGTTPSDVYALLVEDVGLRIFDADGHGPYERTEFEEVFTRPIFNFVARA